MARKMIDFSKLSAAELEQFRDRYDVYIFDMDDCLAEMVGGPIPGVKETLEEIAKNGKTIMVQTDNCMAPLKQIAAHITRMFPVIKKENIMSSGHLVVKYLQEINFNKKIYVMGIEGGVIDELKDFGFDVVSDEEIKKIYISDLRKFKGVEGVGAVLVAADPNFNYLKLYNAANYLADPQVLLLQTHIPNIALKKPVLPGVGSTVAAVKAGSGRKESISVGKGSEYCNKYLKSLGYDIERCLFIGDGLSNDIRAGNLCGMDTLLVFTGSSNLETLKAAKAKNEHNLPTYYANSVADLINAFKPKG